MENNFFETISQFFHSIFQLEDATFFLILIVLIVIILVLKILSKISKIIQFVLIVGAIILIIVWFLK
jgi:hypothetical protein